MKVLVMSEEKWEALDDIFYSEREVIALRKAMTTIDIPDGCVLAVVAENAEKVAAAYPNVAMPLVSLIQEVKL